LMSASPTLTPYRGRFAPSPTGALHFGSLVAALGSWLDARAHQGEWLLRIEDLDSPRQQAGAADAIVRTLEALGLYWDGAISYQSQRLSLYADAMAQLRPHLYACICSRKQIANHAIAGPEGPVYPGWCRGQHHASGAWRFFCPDELIAWHDRLHGPQSLNVARELGDFVLQRQEGIYTYQLAATVDDAAQGITHVVRGADFMLSTARQIVLQQALQVPRPQYLHLPLALDAHGAKWSKQTLAPALNDQECQPLLRAALLFLGQNVPTELRNAPTAELLHHAIASWNIKEIPRNNQYHPA
jgi:glutamyl-Q tRNA(Asp) synthetase